MSGAGQVPGEGSGRSGRGSGRGPLSPDPVPAARITRKRSRDEETDELLARVKSSLETLPGELDQTKAKLLASLDEGIGAARLLADPARASRLSGGQVQQEMSAAMYNVVDALAEMVDFTCLLLRSLRRPRGHHRRLRQQRHGQEAGAGAEGVGGAHGARFSHAKDTTCRRAQTVVSIFRSNT